VRLQKYQVRNEWFSEEVLGLVADLVRELTGGSRSPSVIPMNTVKRHAALRAILRASSEPAVTLDGLRGQLEQIAGIARDALGEQVEGVEAEAATGAPLITDEDLL